MTIKLSPAAVLAALLLLPAIASADIVQRQVITAIAAQQDADGADVLSMANTTGCGGKLLRMDAPSLGMLRADYAAMKQALARQISNKTPMLVILEACPAPGSVGDAAVPVIRRLASCSPAACKDEQARLYLSEELMPQDHRAAPYVLVVPLPPGQQKNTWKVDVYSAKQAKTLRLSAHIDAPDFVEGKRVGDYTFYFPSGKVALRVAQNAQGQQDGEAVQYHEDGSVQARGHWRNGVREGKHSEYHKTGKLSEEITYRNGERVDGLAETFHDNGQLSSRTNYVDGEMDGELLTYYPDGTVESRSTRRKGKLNGTSTFYYPDGKVKNTQDYVNDAADGWSRSWRQDGKLEKECRFVKGDGLGCDVN